MEDKMFQNRDVVFYDRVEDKLDALITVMLQINNSLEELTDAIREK